MPGLDPGIHSVTVLEWVPWSSHGMTTSTRGQSGCAPSRSQPKAIAAQWSLEAASALRAGKLVALPTETVYGLAADAANGAAVARIFEAKGRPRFNPLICHVTDAAMARRYGQLDTRAEKLAAEFWPGPLTLVVPLVAAAPVHPLVTAGLSTIALRVPHGPAHDVIAALGGALAAPSANLSGRLSATRAEHVIAQLGDKVAVVARRWAMRGRA